ncbi:MAG: polyprenyl synthetase family protein, partial [Thermoanaerobaculia bacterium]|nr:polyprenyl synthetase family protein [Thermoanaerobaculia bacterium]
MAFVDRAPTLPDPPASESGASPGAEPRGRGIELLRPVDQGFVLAGFRRLLPLTTDTEPHLRGVIEDALSHPGSMVRAQLAFAIMRGYGVDSIRARSAAVAIEYFHTASLIFDDLPAMDNAVERRGRTCPHLEYGEAAAQLGALALINQAYGLLWGVLDTLSLRQRRQASDLVTMSLGVAGVLNGQSRDLHFTPQSRQAGEVLEVAEGKTVPLIRLTLVLPALIGSAPEAHLNRLARLSELWGLSYQIMDDFKDCLMTDTEAGKSTARDAKLGRPNFPRIAGLSAAWQQLERLMLEARDTVAEFDPD